MATSARYVNNQGLVLTPLAILLSLTCQFSAQAENIYFNPRFLSNDPGAVADLSKFENGLEAPPGKYRVDIYMNGGFMATRNVDFKLTPDGKALDPCINSNQLSAMGVKVLSIPGISALAKDSCVPFSMLSKEASSRFDAGNQRLYLSVPQALMQNQAYDYIPPDMWDNGITAGLLNYTFTGNNAKTPNGSKSSYAYLNLQSGFNWGPWRLRDNSTWSYSDGGSGYHENKWKHVNTYVERDVVPLRGRLTLGDSYTPGDIFDTVNFRGAQLASDDSMLPNSQQGFAPVIHGIARGTAKVTVRQNGFNVYQMTVPPGPFTINDLNASGNSGDLLVTITEADGSTQSFTVPYASVPLLQREGRIKYAMTAGEFRSGTGQQEKPKFAQGTLLWGLPAGFTAFGGTQLSNNYQAYNAGVGKNLGVIGAVSVDATQANSTLSDNSSHQGQSFRFLYNKSLQDTGTNFQIVGYRYSTKGYYSFADTTWQRMSGYTVQTEDGPLQVKPTYTDYYNLAYSKRGRLQATVTQQVGKTSTLYLTGSQQTYWGTSKDDVQLQLGYSSSVKDITYSLNYSLNKNAWQQGTDQVLAFNINIPFSHWMRSDDQSALRQSNISYSSSSDLKGQMSNQVGVYGTLLEDNNLSYSAQTGYSGGGDTSSGSANSASLYYRGTYGNANVGYSGTEGYNQVYYGVSGGVLAHENGITFSQPFNDTIVLIKAPGADHASIENQTGVKTDWRGYAVQPYAMNYRENRIALDTNTLANNVDLDDSVISVVPTYGAVVRADFKTHIGMKVLMTLKHNGKPVPFGSSVSLTGASSESLVGDDGQVYLTGLPESGTLTAKWGNGVSDSCTATYHLPLKDQKQALSYVSAQCD